MDSLLFNRQAAKAEADARNRLAQEIFNRKMEKLFGADLYKREEAAPLCGGDYWNGDERRAQRGSSERAGTFTGLGKEVGH